MRIPVLKEDEEGEEEVKIVKEVKRTDGLWQCFLDKKTKRPRDFYIVMLGQFRTLAMFIIHPNLFEVRTVAGQSFSTRRKSCFSWNDRRRTSRQEQIIYGILILKFILRLSFYH